MDKHRRLGLCFNCDEKYAHRHNCVYKRIFYLELHDNDFEDEDSTEPDPENPVISLHAIAGVTTNKTMHVPVNLGTIMVIALIDLGYTHNFMSEDEDKRTGLPFTPHDHMSVIVANNER
jgi:sugar phosphate isomerase/epimerase